MLKNNVCIKHITGEHERYCRVNMLCLWQSLMTWRCARLWTAGLSGGLPAAPAAPASLKPPPRPPVMETRRRLSSAWSRTFARSCPALRPWSAASRAASAPSPPPATADPPHLARSTGLSRRRPPKAGRRRTRAGSRPMEVRWLHLVTLTQTKTSRSWRPVWTRWRTSWGKEARRLSARMESLPPGRGERFYIFPFYLESCHTFTENTSRSFFTWLENKKDKKKKNSNITYYYIWRNSLCEHIHDRIT